jgi:hypothetical protein
LAFAGTAKRKDVLSTGDTGKSEIEDTPVEHPKGTRFNWVKRTEDGGRRAEDRHPGEMRCARHGHEFHGGKEDRGRRTDPQIRAIMKDWKFWAAGFWLESQILFLLANGWWCCPNLAALADRIRIIECVSLSFIGA